VPDVIVVGAGPVGTLLAAELTRLDVDVDLVERRAEVGAGSRAIGLHPPTLAALEAGGATERILAGAVRVRRGEARSGGRLLGEIRFDRLRMRHPYVATSPQSATEAALAVGAPVARRGVRVTGIRPDGTGVVVESDRGTARAPIVVIATGAAGRDLVFRAAALRRTTYPDRFLMTDATLPPRNDAETAVVHLSPDGVLESFPLPNGRRRFVAWDAGGDAPPVDRLRAAMHVRGEAAAADGVEAASGFEVRRVLAPAMRRGRLFVIGDAAHEVSPIGGQGLNLGLLDAATLAPLLAAWVRAGSPPEDELARWERDRLRSARIAGRMAAVNMRLGRPSHPGVHAVASLGLAATITATGPLLPHTYAMGFDAAAR
jgi:2-polyprenyl-6-methoxyphenol hydroxylase-like FAD-dependent oxidoreductase